MNSLPFPLEVTGLTKIFAGKPPFSAVSNVSFSVKPGEILGLLGPNGAGKSTTIQMLLGTLKPTSGDIRYFGQMLSANRSDVLQSIGYASGYSTFPGNLSVRESLDVQGRLYQLSSADRKTRMEELMQVFEVGNLRNKLGRSLSAGQTTRVSLARAFMGRPRLVLLDEPTASLDPDIAAEVRKFVLREQREEGVSMVYTSHNMVEVTEICDRVLFLKNGRVAAIDTPEKLALKVAVSKLRLRAAVEAEIALEKAMSSYERREGADGWVEFSLDHIEIPKVLRTLHAQGVTLHEIEIQKPTLEDFFLKVSAEDVNYEQT